MEHHTQVYDVRFPWKKKRCPSLFPGWTGSSCNCNGLRYHFSSQQWGGIIRILEDHPTPLPKCDFWGIQFPSGRLSTRHYVSENFKLVEEWRLRRKKLQRWFEASRVLFQINADSLPPPDYFPYLGKKIDYNNRYWLAVFQNLNKVWRWWGVILRVL